VKAADTDRDRPTQQPPPPPDGDIPQRVTKVAAQPFDRVDHVGRSGVKRWVFREGERA
jgi:hypothetical protein